MWPLAACQQKSPREQHKDISDDQTDAAIVFIDSNYPPDSTTAVVDDVTKNGALGSPRGTHVGQAVVSLRASEAIRGSESGAPISQQPECRSGRLKVWEASTVPSTASTIDVSNHKWVDLTSSDCAVNNELIYNVVIPRTIESISATTTTTAPTSSLFLRRDAPSACDEWGSQLELLSL